MEGAAETGEAAQLDIHSSESSLYLELLTAIRMQTWPVRVSLCSESPCPARSDEGSSKFFKWTIFELWLPVPRLVVGSVLPLSPTSIFAPVVALDFGICGLASLVEMSCSCSGALRFRSLDDDVAVVLIRSV